MNLNSFVTGVIGGAVAGGSVGAAAGAAGAAVLAAAGHEGYIPLEATQMGAIGTSILTGGCCAVRGALTSCGMVKADSTKAVLL